MICLGDSHLTNLEHVLRDINIEWCIIVEVLCVPDAIVCAIEDNHFQINLGLIDVLIQLIKSKLLINKQSLISYSLFRSQPLSNCACFYRYIYSMDK